MKPDAFDAVLRVDGSGRAVVTLRGELDMSTAPAAAAVLLTAVAADLVRQVVIDVSGLTFIDAAGVREIVNARHMLIGRHPYRRAEFRIDGATGIVANVLTLLQVVEMEPSWSHRVSAKSRDLADGR
jgi:anti-anti-sigma factor